MSIAGLKAKVAMLTGLIDAQAPVEVPVKVEEIPSQIWLCRDMERKTARCREDKSSFLRPPLTDGEALAWYREMLVEAKQRHANEPNADGGGVFGPGVWKEWAGTYSWRIAVLSLPIKKRLAYLKGVRAQLPTLPSYEVRDVKDILDSIEAYSSPEKAEEVHLNFNTRWYRELDTEIAELENAKS